MSEAHLIAACDHGGSRTVDPGQELPLMQLFDHDGRPQAELLERAGLDHSTLLAPAPSRSRPGTTADSHLARKRARRAG
ncbi:MAG: hypothetical protein H5T76_22475 [Streptomyces sp.]|nr:hypothetical protein [Streptomyces sp.]